MTDKEKLIAIRTEVERLKDSCASPIVICDTLLSFIDSMQEEPTIPDIVDEHYDEMLGEEPVSINFEQELYKAFGQVKDFTLGMQLAKWFYDMGRKYHEPVSEELEEAMQHNAPNNIGIDDLLYWRNGFIACSKWHKENLWKPADGDDLPKIDREVIALLDNGKVVFAHRPPEYWDGKNIVTGKVTRHYPKTYDKGGWNIPNIVYWLNLELPKEKED